MITLDRIRGMLIGVALGDALGVPHEFRYQKNTLYTGNLEHAASLHRRFQPPVNLVIAQYSDDTEMTLALARSLLTKGTYERDDVLLSYLRWANSKTPMLGKNTRALLHGVKTIRGYQSRWHRQFSGDLSTCTQSNGSMMRCTPLSLLANPDFIVEDCYLTNPHPVNQDANLTYLYAVRSALQGYAKFSILENLPLAAQAPEVQEVLRQVQKKEPRDLSTQKGWVLNSLYCAIYSITYFDTYQDAIDWVIRHPGSDTDTNSSIAGGLMGAYLGYEKLMEESRTGPNIQILRSADFSKGDLPRPSEYLLTDFDELTTGLYTKFA